MFKKIIIIMVLGFCVVKAQVIPDLSGSTSYDAVVEEFNLITADGDTLSQWIDKKGYQISFVRFPASYGSTTATILYANDTTATFTKVNDMTGTSITEITGIEAGIPVNIPPVDGYVNFRYARLLAPAAASGADTFGVGLQKLNKQ